MPISVNPPRWSFLQPEWREEILVYSRDFFLGKQIEFPSKKEVFEKTLSGLQYYWYHSDERWHTAVACWIIATYHYMIFTFFPGLNPQGMRETGKTTLLEILRKSAWNPTGREAALREADLFRTIEGSRVTYLTDITRIPPKASEYRDIIDIFESGTEKGGEVRRIDKDTGKPIVYKIYSPKAIASRYEVPFGPKVIRIITEKAKDRKYSERRAMLETDPRWKDEIATLIRGAIKYWPEVYLAYRNLKQTEKLTGRHFNYWAPLLAVCKVYTPEKFDSLLQLAEEYAEKAEKGDQLSEVEDALLAILIQKEGTNCVMLLKDIASEVGERLPWVKHWAIVKSAIDNLGVSKKRYDVKKGVAYELDLEKARKLVETRGVTLSGEQQGVQESGGNRFSLDDLASVFWAGEPLTKKECGVCGNVKPTVWRAETVKGEVIIICEDCVQAFQKRREEV